MEIQEFQTVYTFLSKIQKLVSAYREEWDNKKICQIANQLKIDSIREQLIIQSQEIDRSHILSQAQELSLIKQLSEQQQSQYVSSQQTQLPITAKQYILQLIHAIQQIQHNGEDHSFIYQLINQIELNIVDFQSLYKIIQNVQKRQHQNQILYLKKKIKQLQRSNTNQSTKAQVQNQIKSYKQKLSEHQRKIDQLSNGILKYDFKADKIVFVESKGISFELKDPIKVKALLDQNAELFMAKKALDMQEKRTREIRQKKTREARGAKKAMKIQQRMPSTKFNDKKVQNNVQKGKSITQKYKDQSSEGSVKTIMGKTRMDGAKIQNVKQHQDQLALGNKKSENFVSEKQKQTRQKIQQFLKLRKENQKKREQNMKNKPSWIRAYSKSQQKSKVFKEMIIISKCA